MLTNSLFSKMHYGKNKRYCIYDTFETNDYDDEDAEETDEADAL